MIDLLGDGWIVRVCACLCVCVCVCGCPAFGAFAEVVVCSVGFLVGVVDWLGNGRFLCLAFKVLAEASVPSVSGLAWKRAGFVRRVRVIR